MKKSNISAYIKAEAALKAAEAKVAEARAALEAELAEARAEELTAFGYIVSLKTYESSRIDSKRLKAEEPELAAKYSMTTISRRFTVKPAK